MLWTIFLAGITSYTEDKEAEQQHIAVIHL